MEVLRFNTLEAKALAVRRLYDARMTEIAQNLQRAPSEVQFCKTCALTNKWPVAVSEMSAEEYQTHLRDDLNEALELLKRNWDPRQLASRSPDAHTSAAGRWFCTIDTRTKCHACGLGFDLVHVFDPAGDDTFPEEQKAAADSHRVLCPIREVEGWRTDVTQPYNISDYCDQFVHATYMGDDIMSLVGEDFYDEFIRPRLSPGRIATSQRYFDRKALAAQIELKHCPKCLRASSTTLMGKKMHERVCQLTRSDWVTLERVQPFRAREGVDGREMVMDSNGLLERRFRIMAPDEKARLERKYERQLYTRLNMDHQSLTLLGDDSDSEDVSSDQDDRLIARGRGPRRRRPHRRPINSDNSDDENDYGPGHGGEHIIQRPEPTLEEYNSWHAAMAPTVSNDRDNPTEHIVSRFRMEFQEMLQQNSPIATGVAAPQIGPPPTVRPLRKQKAPPSTQAAPGAKRVRQTGQTTPGAKRVRQTGQTTPRAKRVRQTGRTTPGAKRVRQTGRTTTGQLQAKTPRGRARNRRAPLGSTRPKSDESMESETDRERIIDVAPTSRQQRIYDQMPEGFVSAVTETTLLNDPIAFSDKLLTLGYLQPLFFVETENERAAKGAAKGTAKKVRKGKKGATAPDTRSTLDVYTDFFLRGGLSAGTTRPAGFLEILRYSDAMLESDHSFFQFLFPIDSISKHGASAPPMPAGFRRAMRDPTFSGLYLLSVRRVMTFWGFHYRGLSSNGRPLWRLLPGFVAANHGWTRPVDHNHQLVGQVIRSLRLAGEDRVARSIYRCMARTIRKGNFRVSEEAQRLWRREALGPVGADPLAGNFPPDADLKTDSEPEGGGGAGGLGPGNLDGANDDQEGSEGGADTDPEAFTPGSGPAPPATEQAGGKRPNESTEGGSHKRQRFQPATDTPVGSEDSPAYRSSDDQGEFYSGNSSSSEGFLDPHERDEEFIPKRLPLSPTRAYSRKAAVKHAPPVVAPARAPVGARGSHESVSKRGGDNIITSTDQKAVPVTQPQEIQQTAQSGQTPTHLRPRPKRRTREAQRLE